jgi:hypothetical protein
MYGRFRFQAGKLAQAIVQIARKRGNIASVTSPLENILVLTARVPE